MTVAPAQTAAIESATAVLRLLWPWKMTGTSTAAANKLRWLLHENDPELPVPSRPRGADEGCASSMRWLPRSPTMRAAGVSDQCCVG
ncbi:hypothetical protein [Streptomyces shenzhenensis]|uniref:hypothetical protein n=1 Tax=Streptomyces shenzhenensis TaxID=943815 RepID=UPI001F43C5CB|nr:hypothetical protein [Streptomyces shenzhenensis]